MNGGGIVSVVGRREIGRIVGVGCNVSGNSYF